MLLAVELKPSRANDKTQKLIPKKISPIVVKQKVCKDSKNVNPLLLTALSSLFLLSSNACSTRDLQ